MTEYISYYAIQDDGIYAVYHETIADDSTWQRLKTEYPNARIMNRRWDLPYFRYEQNVYCMLDALMRVWLVELGHLSERHLPAISYYERANGRWGARCRDCQRVVCNPMNNLDMVMASAEQHRIMEHEN